MIYEDGVSPYICTFMACISAVAVDAETYAEPLLTAPCQKHQLSTTRHSRCARSLSSGAHFGEPGAHYV